MLPFPVPKVPAPKSFLECFDDEGFDYNAFAQLTRAKRRKRKRKANRHLALACALAKAAEEEEDNGVKSLSDWNDLIGC